jgi:hypothetical protein
MSIRMTIPRRSLTAIAASMLALAAVLPVQAQYADRDLGMKGAERDSLAASYHNIFPILGHKAVERGVRLPAPLGLNLNYFAGSQDIAISNLALAVNEREWVDLSNVILFEDATSEIENLNLRTDLWVLPFLNVYGILGQSWATTSVSLSSPVAFTSRAEMEGMTYGTGFTGAGGLQGFWFAYDMNWTWSDLDILDDAVRTRILGLRVGKNYRWRDKSVAAWIGAMKVDLESGTQGVVKLSEVFPEVPPELGDRFDEWYNGLTPPQQGVVDKIREAMDEGNLGDTEIHYNLDKAPTQSWSMAIGGQIEFTRNWQFRSELNCLGGRTTLLANLVYRIDI